MGEIPRFARDDRVVRVASASEAVVAGRRFVFEGCSRSQRRIAPRYVDAGSKVPDLDAVIADLARVGRRNAAL